MRSVDIFVWDDHFNTGIKAIDLQHRRLVALLNRLAILVVYQSTDDKLSTIFDELVEYTVYHFQTEEEIWHRYFQKDSLEDEHKATHQKFVDTVIELKKERESKLLFEVTNKTLEFLTHWLASHILESDRYMAYIVIALEENCDIDTAKARAKEKMSDLNHILVEIILSTYSALATHIKYQRDIETILEHEREFLKTLIQTIPDLVWMKDPNGVYLMCNHRFEDLYGAKESEIVGKTDYDFVEKSLADSFRFYDQLAIHNNKPSTNEEEFVVDNNGPKEIFQTIKTPIYDSNGTILGVLGIGRNITVFKQIQKNLILERNRFEKYLHTAEAIILSLDKNGCITLINRKGCELLEYTQEELIGKEWFELCLAQPEGMERIYPIFVQIMAGQIKGSEYFENTIKTKSGKMYLIEWHNSYLTDENSAIIGTLSTGEDITERKKAEESLRLLSSVFTHSREAIFITSAENKIIDINQSVQRITGYTKEELIGQTPKILQSGQHTPSFYNDMWQKLNTNGYWSGEISNRRKNGELYVEYLTISTIKDDNGNISHYVALFSDITSLKEQQKRLEYIAHYDALTGLPNRVLLADLLMQAIAQTQKNRSILAVVYLDLDGFKAINDTYGHDSGDILLSIVAERTKQTLRRGDTVARLGGDEFVAILLNLNTHEECMPLLHRLLNAASEVVKYNNIEMRVTASLGVSFCDYKKTIDADQLLRQADQAMYHAKLLGKNRFYFFDAHHDATIRTHYEKLKTIENALIDHQFVLYYQPKVNMRSGELIGLEALIRWQHPQKGVLSPNHFLPIIKKEDFLMSIKIGEWVLEEVFRQILRWKSNGLSVKVSVNIDIAHLLQGNIAHYIKGLFAKYPDVQPDNLMLEVLETGEIDNISQVITIMKECKDAGVTFALDDFGTGYSSLTYLKRLPASELKIDQSFVRDMLHNVDDLSIIHSIIDLADAFHLNIIAEGVETIEQGEMLIKMGCDNAQGYAIARPMPSDKVIEWIKHWKPNPKCANITRLNDKEIELLYTTLKK